MEIHELYVIKKPSAQNAVDIMKDSWSSRFPLQFQLSAGEALLFQDPRVEWALQQMGGVSGMDILELGPLEAAHTWMLTNAGASHVTAIEANQRAFIKCLITKEVLQIQNATFLLGDFVSYMAESDQRYDLICASGVMYHMRKPLEFLQLLSERSDVLYLWTHYFDETLIRNSGTLDRFDEPESVPFGNREIVLRPRTYEGAENQAVFCGGAFPNPCWMERADILSALESLGFGKISIGHEQPSHPNGPCFAIVAQR